MPPATEPVERAIPFASLTPAQAADLVGKVRTYRVVLDSAPGGRGRQVGYDAAHDDVPGDQGQRRPHQGGGRRRHGGLCPWCVAGGGAPRRDSRVQFGGFVEYRLVGTVE